MNEIKMPTIESTGTATYCPEDDKLRLYVGRVPREEYDFLRGTLMTMENNAACYYVPRFAPVAVKVDRKQAAGELMALRMAGVKIKRTL